MSEWTKEELAKIAAADDLYISPFREDGVTFGTPTWIWSVVVGDGLYVRGYNGPASRWYKAAVTQKAGRIRVAGMDRQVIFEPIMGGINEQIDAAYRDKYQSSPYLSPMVANKARAATVKIKPR